jgi:hypothetical protein
LNIQIFDWNRRRKEGDDDDDEDGEDVRVQQPSTHLQPAKEIPHVKNPS